MYDGYNRREVNGNELSSRMLFALKSMEYLNKRYSREY